jgi:hypothetical protein
MTDPQFHGRFRTVPASLLLETLGESLKRIRDEDKATDGDLAAVLGKSEDSAARYRAGNGDMGVVSFLRGCREWDGRFANDALALVGMKLTPIDGAAGCDRAGLSALCALLAKKSAALENDGIIDDAELEDMWPELEAAAKHIDRLRDRRRLRAVANG